MKQKTQRIEKTLWVFALSMLISFMMVNGMKAETTKGDLVEETGALFGQQMYIGNDDGLFVIDRKKSTYKIMEQESIDRIAEGLEPGYVYYTFKAKEGLYRLDEKNKRMKILDGQVDGFAFTNKGLYYQQGEAFYLLYNGQKKEIFKELKDLHVQSVEVSGEKAYFLASNRIVEGNLLTGELNTLLDIQAGEFKDIEVMNEQLYCIVEDDVKRALFRVELPSKKVLKTYMEGRYQMLHRHGDQLYTLLKKSNGQVYVKGLNATDGEVLFTEELSEEVKSAFFDEDRLVANREFFMDLQFKEIKALGTAMEEALEEKAKSTEEAKEYLMMAFEKSANQRRMFVKNIQREEYGQQWMEIEDTYNFSLATEEVLNITKKKASTSTDEYDESIETYYKEDMYFYRYGKGEEYNFSYLDEYESGQLQYEFVWGLLGYLKDSQNLSMKKENGKNIITLGSSEDIMKILKKYYGYVPMGQGMEQSVINGLVEVIIDSKTKKIHGYRLEFDLENVMDQDYGIGKLTKVVDRTEISYRNLPSITVSSLLRNKVKNYGLVKAFSQSTATSYEKDKKYVDSLQQSKKTSAPEYYLYLTDKAETWEQIFENYEKYIKLHPGDLQRTYRYLYYKTYYGGEFDQGLGLPLLDTLAYRPYIYRLWYLDTANKGDKEVAKSILTEWKKEFPYDYYAIRRELVQFIYDSKYEEARKIFRQCQPNDSTGYGLITWSMAYGEFLDGNYEESKVLYKKAKRLLGKDEIAFYKEYMYSMYSIMEYTEAYQLAKTLLEADEDNESAKWMIEVYEKNNLGYDGSALIYVTKDYLYYDSNAATVKAAEDKIKMKRELTGEEIVAYLKEVILPEDQFTYLFKYEKEEIPKAMLEQKVIGNKEYLGFNQFTTGIGDEFVAAIKSIKNPEEKELILDLRGNGGGSMYEAEKILDVLLPQCISTTLIDQQGYVTTVESDKDMVTFKKIYVLINEQSASASEVVALSLREYLDYVVIMGRKSYGKGVSQSVITNPSYGYQLWLVKHYWNVKQKNIHDKGIVPDIKVTGKSLEDYLKLMK